jgi:hypothetical protein
MISAPLMNTIICVTLQPKLTSRQSLRAAISAGGVKKEMLSTHELMSSRKTIRFRASLINDYSDQLSRCEPFRGESPYVSTFKKSPFELTFVAAKHVYGFENSTCKTIKKIFSLREFKHIIYEGELVSQGENVYAAKLAKQYGISCSSGEPSKTKIKKDVLKKGHKLMDLRFFYGLRQIPQIILGLN